MRAIKENRPRTELLKSGKWYFELYLNELELGVNKNFCVAIKIILCDIVNK